MRLLQEENTLSPIDVPLVITTVFKFPFGIYEIAKQGIVTLSILEQSLNELLPINVTLSGIVMLVRLLQEENAEDPIPTVFSLRTTVVTEESQSIAHLST